MLHIGTHAHPLPHNDALYLLMHRGSILVESTDQYLFELHQFQPEAQSQPIYCGQWQEKDVFVCLLKRIPNGFIDIALRELLLEQDEARYLLLSRARQLATWDNDHQFCGRCGTHLDTRHPIEHTKICGKCTLRHYPRISPCIIVSIRHGKRILLARGPLSPPGRFSNIAGFVEAGETLEQAVAREVQEEVGLTVNNIRYTSSQPWSFPHQLMAGFLADYESGDITPAEGEIVEADWYDYDQLPLIPPTSTISGQIIRQHIEFIKKEIL